MGSKTRALKAETGIDDYFVEVYIPHKKRWRPIDIENHKVFEDSQDLTPHLEQPVSHLIGVEGDGCMVDLSPKYNADWLNKKNTLRRDAKFFDETLAPHAPREEELIEEQEEAANKHEQQGLPTTFSEFKNHPKYALKRHMLKCQAFYPKNPPVLGEFRGELVYPREAVHVLRSRDQWYRNARTVLDGEEPYATVKARPKFDRKQDTWVTGQMMDVFGEWQTGPFKPPSAVNGKIPRNAYGNVDLFHPEMLPLGTVYLELPGLNKVAADLELDCAPCVIGFEGIGRAFHAVYRG